MNCQTSSMRVYLIDYSNKNRIRAYYASDLILIADEKWKDNFF